MTEMFEQLSGLAFPAPLPSALLKVRQHFDAPEVDDIAGAVAAALRDSGALGRIPPATRSR